MVYVDDGASQFSGLKVWGLVVWLLEFRVNRRGIRDRDDIDAATKLLPKNLLCFLLLPALGGKGERPSDRKL